jgi:predicted amino acid-binding ACT domain protein
MVTGRAASEEVSVPDETQRVQYHFVTVEDEPGAVQNVLTALTGSGVNLLAFHGFPAGEGRSQIDLVPEDPEALRQAAAQVGVALSEPRWALYVQGEDRVGAIADITSALAEASINITAASAVGAGADRFGVVIWVPPEDYEQAAQVLGATS